MPAKAGIRRISIIHSREQIQEAFVRHERNHNPSIRLAQDIALPRRHQVPREHLCTPLRLHRYDSRRMGRDRWRALVSYAPPVHLDYRCNGRRAHRRHVRQSHHRPLHRRPKPAQRRATPALRQAVSSRHDAPHSSRTRRVHLRSLPAEHSGAGARPRRCRISHLLPIHQAIHLDIQSFVGVGARDRPLRRMDRRDRQPHMAARIALARGCALGRQLRHPLPHPGLRLPETGRLALRGKQVRCSRRFLVGANPRPARAACAGRARYMARPKLALLHRNSARGGLLGL